MFLGLIWTSPEERDEISIEVFRRKTVETWSILEAHLFDRDYVTASSFNMADIPLGVSIYRWGRLDVEKPLTPNLEAWHARLRDRPAFRENVMLPLS